MTQLNHPYARSSRPAERALKTRSLADLNKAISGLREVAGLLRADGEPRLEVEAQLSFCPAARFLITEAAPDRDAAIDGLLPLVGRDDPAGRLDGSRKILGA
jgi:hypothetical protein